MIKKLRKVLQMTDSFLEQVEAGLPRCKNCGKPIGSWQKICKWCGFSQW